MGKVVGLDGQPSKTAKINIKASDMKDVVCDNCEGKVFKEVIMLKRVSALVSPTGKEQLVPVQVIRCDDCGHINKEFLPKNTIE